MNLTYAIDLHSTIWVHAYARFVIISKSIRKTQKQRDIPYDRTKVLLYECRRSASDYLEEYIIQDVAIMEMRQDTFIAREGYIC